MAAPRNVLVVGAPRSGTTLIAGLISGLENTDAVAPMIPECTHITQIIRSFYNTLHFSDPQRFSVYAIDEATLSAMYRNMVESMLRTVYSHLGSSPYKNLVLKDPELTQFIDFIPTFFGKNCKVVYVVRDPRSVVASMLEIEQKRHLNPLRALIHTPSWTQVGGILEQFLRKKNLITTILTYYWWFHSSKMYKDGVAHTVQYEKITAFDESEFSALEQYLEFPISRRGFGKMTLEFDRKDPTFSAGYGGAIHKDRRSSSSFLSYRQIREIKRVFFELNKIYRWW